MGNNTGGDRPDFPTDTGTNEDDPFLFEGEPLLHSPRLGRRFLGWLSD